MTNRYEEASEGARQLLENFDEIDLAEMLASSNVSAATLNARIAELEAKREKDAAINAQVDAETEEQLNGATEVAQYFKALSERTQAWGDQHRDRANRYRARTDAVTAELHALNSETRGLNPFAMAGRRDAVARIRTALATITHETQVPDDPRVTALKDEVARLRSAWKSARCRAQRRNRSATHRLNMLGKRRQQIREAEDRAVRAEAAIDATYRERAHLVALLAALHPSHIGHTDPNAPEWAVVTVETPAGQMTWHIAERDMDLFAHVQPTNRICRGWDGHTTEEKYQRMRDLTEAAPCLLGQDDLIERQAEHIKRLTSRVAELEKQAAGD